MSRSRTKIFIQPNGFSCGPSSLKIALRTLNIQVSYDTLFTLCKTTRTGTNAAGLIRAANRLGLCAMTVHNSTLTHLQSALRSKPGQERAVIVDYLYLDETPEEETGHFAAVAGYSSRLSRIILFDSFSGTKKSYLWTDFLDRWYGYEYKRIKNKQSVRHLSLYRRWQNRHMIILAKSPKNLPDFRTPHKKIYLPKKSFTSSLVRSFQTYTAVPV